MAFNIQITAGDSAANSSVIATGSDTHPITNAEQTALNITTGQVLNLLASPCWGAKPDDCRIFYWDPTPWGNMFFDNKVPPCSATVSVLSATVVGVTKQNQQYVGNSCQNLTDDPISFTATATAAVTNTIGTSWSENSTFETTQSISYGLSLLGLGASGETSLTWSSTMSNGGSTDNAITLGTGMSALVTVDPGEEAQAFFEVSQGTLTVQIEYEVTVGGNVWMNYPDTAIIPAHPDYGQHHFFNVPVADLLTPNNFPTSATFVQTIDVGYYFDGKLIVKDGNGQILASKTCVPGDGVDHSAVGAGQEMSALPG